MRRILAAMLLAALAQASPLQAADDDCPGAEQGFQRLKHDDLEFAFRWDPAELKVGRFFAVEVVVCSAPGDWQRGLLAISATMPAHDHGMNYRPAAERITAGRYRFTGLMLHMAGTWRFSFSLISGDVGLMLEHDVDLRQ
jgi:hypothetical protein